MRHKRIVVTGMGIVSCFGNDVNTFYNQLLAGKSGITTVEGCEELPTRIGGVIKNFDPEDYLDKKQARRVDPFIAYGVVAGKKALEMAGITKETPLAKEKCGVVLGSGMGGMGMFANNVQAMLEKGPKRVSPFFVPYIITNMAGALLGMDYGFMGPNYSISTACATGNNSLIAAANHIRMGDADVMITGGVEAAIIPMGLAGFSACKALSQRNDEPEKASRPWDQNRDGFVMGEGAGVLVLETLEHALERGATIYGEYLGHGMTCDAYHMTEPRPDGKGVAGCMRKALENAGLEANQVDYVNAHATSTPAGDMVEINAMKQVFEDPSQVTINATKSMIGHCLGGASGVEAIASIMAIHTQKIHPTINLENPEPDLGFSIPMEALEKDVKVAMSNSFGFGGHNATVIFGKYEGS